MEEEDTVDGFARNRRPGLHGGNTGGGPSASAGCNTGGGLGASVGCNTGGGLGASAGGCNTGGGLGASAGCNTAGGLGASAGCGLGNTGGGDRPNTEGGRRPDEGLRAAGVSATTHRTGLLKSIALAEPDSWLRQRLAALRYAAEQVRC